MALNIPGVRGKGLTITKVVKGYQGHETVFILTGKRKKPDSLSWSASIECDQGDFEVHCQGLYRGSYADATVLCSDLYRVLEEQAPTEAFSLLRAWIAWIGA